MIKTYVATRPLVSDLWFVNLVDTGPCPESIPTISFLGIYEIKGISPTFIHFFSESEWQQGILAGLLAGGGI